jgi:hypothetical protein
LVDGRVSGDEVNVTLAFAAREIDALCSFKYDGKWIVIVAPVLLLEF